MMKFRKMHGLGNDFVIVDQRGGRQVLDKAFVAKAADRHFGVGCDQFIVMEPSEKADVFMRIYNTDGSEAESCGNATRCVADIILSDSGKPSCTIETLGGLLQCRRVDGGMVEVDMGAAKNIAIPAHDWGAGLGDPVGVDMGNPHAVFFVDDIGAVKIEQVGPGIETHKAFPNRTNVEFAQVLPGNKIRTRVWERGVGVTLACGSGACATAVAAAQKGLSALKTEIIMDGGSLFLEYRESDGHVLMTGPVAYVFEGEFNA